MPTDDWWRANQPLFEQRLVGAVEWSVDFGWGPGGAPGWVEALLEQFARGDRAYAHGVELSAMSARWTEQHADWMRALRATCAARRFRHLTEHYGFITAGDFVRGTPLPLPPSAAAMRIAVSRLEQLREASELPVGIENLAFALSAPDALAQAAFVRALLDRSDAFLLLDVHNLHCQAHNFGLDALELARAYGLDRVREIHVAGGSWSASPSDPEGRPFRRDTHDAPAPEQVLQLLQAILPECPGLEVIILERTDRSLFGDDEVAAHRAEFARLRELARRARPQPAASAAHDRSARYELQLAADDAATLDRYQATLLATLDGALAPGEVRAALLEDQRLAPYHRHITTFEARALDVGRALVKQWGQRDGEMGTMQAAVLAAPRTPLQLRNLPMVEPRAGQVLLRVHAVGLCGTDAHIHDGRFPVPMPIVLGHETVGVVEGVGDGVDHPRVGDRVGLSWVQAGCGACAACERGAVQRCVDPCTWIHNGGGLSQWAVAEAAGCTVLPDGLGFEQAAPLFCAGHVAASGLRRALPCAGERVAVLGLGGLGHLAIQIARAAGHDVMALSSSAAKRKDALELGASAAIDPGDDVGDALAAAGGADIVLATTSSMQDVARAVRGLRVGGRLVLLGLGSGELAIDPVDLVQREASVIGAVQGSSEDLRHVLALAARGALRARVESYPLLLAQRALTRLLEGRVRYRAVVTLA